jgi:anti-sigma factor RsiW
MNENVHSRAQKLFAQSLVEGLGAAEQSWLEQHLHECTECSREAATTQKLLQAFRSVPVAAPRDLAARTQMRVRLRAQESERSSSSALLWVITAASWLLGVFSAPLVWHGFTWVGTQLNLPKPVLELGFVLWWTVPALIAVAVVLQQRAAGVIGAGSRH